MLSSSSKEDPIELLRETTAPQFVINLCASTTPVALSHPSSAELKRYTFFVTRRRDEGRERFRLHMGYFESLEAADAMLAAVRDVYPAAWAGPAPEGRMGAPRNSQAAAPRVVALPPSVPAAAVEAAAVPEPAVTLEAPAALTLVAAAPITPAQSAQFELDSMSNVREVLAELGDEPAKAAAQPQPDELTPKQTLQLLELPAPPEQRIEVLTPEDTQTLRDIKLDAQSNAPPSYAVQLVWSVAPIVMESLPHLAIFDAYTLYHVEGSRQGRRWYGLRLGFFSDAEAARQVAQYVRSEYAAVAVVPVTGKEKAGADAPLLATPAPQPAPPTRPEFDRIPTVRPLEKNVQREAAMTGFELLVDDSPVPAKRDLDDVGARTANPAAVRAMPPRATGKPAGKRVVVRKQTKPSPPGAPQPLDSTLEILGASTLTIDESREVINDSAIRRHSAPKNKTGRFSRLLSRLSDRGGR